MRRLMDQALILEAISEVRKQIRDGMTIMDQVDVMTRLATLYALLDVARLKIIVERTDERDLEQDSPIERKVA